MYHYVTVRRRSVLTLLALTLFLAVSGKTPPLTNKTATVFSTDFTVSASEYHSGPILVIAKASNPFSRYTTEMLLAQGLNEFDVKDISEVNSSLLDEYDVVILGEMALSSTNVSDLSDWVNDGGTLICFRPDAQLAPLLGISPVAGNLSDQYLLVHTAAGPGVGIVNETIQFHGTADYYTLSGASALATLYLGESNSTIYPAITAKTVGTNGGRAIAFTYDLAKSIVLTRQGNPAWAGQNRDGQPGPERSDDLFFGDAAGDAQPDWVDLSKVSIPQADEQLHLLTNIITQYNLHQSPLPRFWFLPSGKKAAVVMTGDDHGNGGTIGRFNQYLSLSGTHNNPTDVADWKAIRGSSYIFPNTPITNTEAMAFTAQGFEIGLHLNTGCANFTPTSLENDFTAQLSQMTANFPGIPATGTHRTHCIAWSDWATMAKKEVANGIRLDVNYYYWPGAWVQDRPGMFTGSGMPMRFADTDGTLIDCYQVTTQLTDESGISYTAHINSLLDKATGPEGFYGVFCANMHTDVNGSNSTNGSDAIINSAIAHDIPVVSAKQMLTWLDGRNSSTFTDIDFNGTTLSFTITTNTAARNLKAMLPVSANGSKQLQSLLHNSTAVPYTIETIKGIQYAFFDAQNGNYSATYAMDNTAPVITAIVATPGTGGTATITWTTDEAADSRVDYGTNTGNLSMYDTDPALVTSHSITLHGLGTGVTYYFRVTAADAVANSATEPLSPAAPLSFTMPTGPCANDMVTADFSAGTTDANTMIITDDDGGVSLRSSVNENFDGTVIPSGWTAEVWDGQSGAVTTVNGGQVTVNGTHVYYNTPFVPGTAAEFTATFSAGNFQNIGFTGDAGFNNPWIVIGRGSAGDNDVYARTSSNQSVSLGSGLLNAPHRYRIQWIAGSNTFVFYVDGNLIPTPAITITAAGNLFFQVSDYPAGGPALSVDDIRFSPYNSPGTFTSRIVDAGAAVNWGVVNWTADVPVNTTLNISVRKGNTAVPDGSWSAFTPVTNGGTTGCTARYIQYKADFTTADNMATPVLKDISIACSNTPDNMPPVISNAAALPSANGTALITWSTNEAATSVIQYGTAPGMLTMNHADAAFVLNHSISLSGLSNGTTYYYKLFSTDCSGNSDSSTISSFTVPYPVTVCLNDQSVADFTNGNTGGNIYISPRNGGELILLPAIAQEFSGNTIPAGWQSFSWTGGGSSVSGGMVAVDGARLNTVSPNNNCTQGTGMEFTATFAPATFQHVGFGGGSDATGSGGIYNGESPWAMFSTGNSTSVLKARVFNGSSAIDFNIPGSFIGTSHLYRIDWNTSGFDFYIDGALVYACAAAINTPMRPAISDYSNDGNYLTVDWIQVSPYATAGTYESAVMDAGAVKNWGAANWNEEVPPGTTLTLFQRQSNSATAIVSEPWTPVVSNGDITGGASQFIQYKAEFTTTDNTVTPVLKDFSIACSTAPLLTLSGNIWHDVNGMSDGMVNNSAAYILPTPPAIPVGLRVYLVNTLTGLVEQIQFINNDGTWSFTGVTPNNVYHIYLTSSQNIIGNPPSGTLLPSGWIHTGQKLGGSAGSDGLNDGILVIPATTNDVININFGIKLKSGDAVVG